MNPLISLQILITTYSTWCSSSSKKHCNSICNSHTELYYLSQGSYAAWAQHGNSTALWANNNSSCHLTGVIHQPTQLSDSGNSCWESLPINGGSIFPAPHVK